MRFPASLSILPTFALLLACNGGSANSNAAASTTPAAAATTPPANADLDKPANGAGVPPGYVGRTDDSTKSIADAKYTPGMGGTWEVQTGPAHILYSPKDTVSGTYTLHTEIDQLEAPHHPEAYGVIIGGQNLLGPGQRYAYFIVRGNGMYAIKVRDGATARSVVDFTASPNVPTADASGRASYVLTVKAAPDSVHFLVNEKPVAAVATAALAPSVCTPPKPCPAAVAGTAGIRINHNLHVTVKPLVISQ